MSVRTVKVVDVRADVIRKRRDGPMKTRTSLRTALPALAGALLVLAPAGVGLPAASSAASPSAEAPSSSSSEDVADPGSEHEEGPSEDSAPVKSSNGRDREKRTGPPVHAAAQDKGKIQAEGAEDPESAERGAARQGEPGGEKEPRSSSVGNGPPDHVRDAAARPETGDSKRRSDGGGSVPPVNSGGSKKPPADAGGSGRDTGGPDRTSPPKGPDSSPDAGGSKRPPDAGEPGSSRDTDSSGPSPDPDAGKRQRPPHARDSRPATPPAPPATGKPRAPEPPKTDDDHPRSDGDDGVVAPPPRPDRGASDDEEQGAVAPRDTNTRARTSPSTGSSPSIVTGELDVSAEIANHGAQARSAAGVADGGREVEVTAAADVTAAASIAAELEAPHSAFAFEIARRSADAVARGLRQAGRSVPGIDPLMPPRQFALTSLMLALVGGFLALQRIRPQTAPPMSLSGDRRRDDREGVHVRYRL